MEVVEDRPALMWDGRRIAWDGSRWTAPQEVQRDSPAVPQRTATDGCGRVWSIEDELRVAAPGSPPIPVPLPLLGGRDW